MRSETIERPERQVPSLLDEVLERRMLLYVLAAGATLAGPTATQAKIVFTPSSAAVAYGVCNTSASLQIDLNNDGVNDFTLRGDTFCYSGNGISIFKSSLNADGSAASNGIVGINNNYGRLARGLRKGAGIGSTANFSDKGLMQLRNFAELPKSAPKGAPSNYSFGSFLDITNRYLGVRFQINGETHYGWIGFRSTSEGNAQLAGWAYETAPNTPIHAGRKGEINSDSHSDSVALRAPGLTSLELLATGHTGVAERQRRIAGTV
jgi:hypothetical protein